MLRQEFNHIDSGFWRQKKLTSSWTLQKRFFNFLLRLNSEITHSNKKRFFRFWIAKYYLRYAIKCFWNFIHLNIPWTKTLFVSYKHTFPCPPFFIFLKHKVSFQFLIGTLFSILFFNGDNRRCCGLILNYIISNSDHENICKTNGGPYPNETCEFPFIFGGKTYNGCVDFHGNFNTTWCSILVDDQNVHIKGMWGYCGVGCPKMKMGIPNHHETHGVFKRLVTCDN